MASKHGTRRCYNEGCRCDKCREANRVYGIDLRQRRAAAEAVMPQVHPVRSVPESVAADPAERFVEAAVREELRGLSLAKSRPGLAAAAIALGRLLDSPRAVAQQPAAASKLADLLDKLHKGASARRSQLATVRQMTTRKAAEDAEATG